MTRPIEVPDAPQEAFEALYERGWTDGLPVIPPTPQLVAEMVGHANASSGDTVVTRVPPSLREATVEALAVNAVMAGCRPEYFPAVLAAVTAMCRPEFNLSFIQGTGDSVGVGAIINGSIRLEIDVNCREGVAGPGWRANATIGRALRLIMINVGGGIPGTVDRAMVGQPAKYSLCIGENEEQSPWEPLSVCRGFAPGEAAITVVPVMHTHIAWPLVVDVETTLASMVDAMTCIGNINIAYGAPPVTWIVPPANANLLAKAGYTREALQEHLFEHARLPQHRFPYGAGRMWEYEPVVVDGQVLVVTRPEDVVIAVSGGSDYTGALYLGGSYACHPLTERIERATKEGATQ